MKKIILLLVLPLVISGCTIIKVNKSTTPASQSQAAAVGFYKTIDRGENWTIKSNILGIKGEAKNFAGVNVTAAVIDPTDPKTIYLGTVDRGLMYSTNSGEGWLETLTGLGVINGIAVDPESRCTVYAVVFNKVYKTSDCSRSWKMVQLSSLEGEYYSAIAVDQQNTRQVYVGTSKGTLLISRDAGFSWEATKYFPSRVSQLIVNPAKIREIYVATVSSGVYLTADNGVTWKNLGDLEVENSAAKSGQPNRKLKDLSGAANYLSLVYDYSDLGSLLYSNNYGMFRLTPGNTWREISILNKPKEERILSLAINTSNGQEIFFVTGGAFYQSKDAGVNWTVRKLPTPGIPRLLLINPTNANELYVSFYKA
ncbi:MAG: hypothetical protein V1846_01810 [Candidatus Komeilibacteria bacterium]